MSHLYLGAVAFGVTLLIASLVLGGKDAHVGGAGHDGGGDAHGDHGDVGIGWLPVTSLRFWVFFFAFGGGAGFALTQLESSELVAGGGALGIGWAAGALAVEVVHRLSRNSVSSGVDGAALAGATGIVMLPIGRGRPGKVRVKVKGRTEDFVANLVDEAAGELPTGAEVLIVAEGEQGTLLVGKLVL